MNPTEAYALAGAAVLVVAAFGLGVRHRFGALGRRAHRGGMALCVSWPLTMVLFDGALAFVPAVVGAGFLAASAGDGQDAANGDATEG